MGISFSSFGRTEKLSDITIDCDLPMAAHAITINAGGLIDSKDVSVVLDNLDLKKKYDISDDLLHSHDAESNTVSTTYIKAKTITLDTLFLTPSTIRIKFDIRRDTGGDTIAAYGRIYKNGGAVGTERSTTSATYVTFSEDISFAEGDTLELYIHATGGWNMKAENFRVHGIPTIITLQEALTTQLIGLDTPFVGSNT